VQLSNSTGNTAVAVQANGNNFQNTLQVGTNLAVTEQQSPANGVASNAAFTTQVGTNAAFTKQVIANPGATGTNLSQIAQFGGANGGNIAVASQSDSIVPGLQPMIGANTQTTLQLGSNNLAVTQQVASGSLTNASVTAQFGSHNTAVTVQH